MLETGFPDLSFRVLLRESAQRQEAVLDELRERVTGLLAIALVIAVPLYGLVSGTDFSLVEESVAAEPTSSLRAFGTRLVRSEAAFNRLEAGQLSAAEIRTVQTRLKYVGFDPGPIDGIAGKRTLAALNAYRQSIGLAPVPAVNRETTGDLRYQ